MINAKEARDKLDTKIFEYKLSKFDKTLQLFEKAIDKAIEEHKNTATVERLCYDTNDIDNLKELLSSFGYEVFISNNPLYARKEDYSPCCEYIVDINVSF